MARWADDFLFSAHSCHVSTPSSQNLEVEQHIWVFANTKSWITNFSMPELMQHVQTNSSIAWRIEMRNSYFIIADLSTKIANFEKLWLGINYLCSIFLFSFYIFFLSLLVNECCLRVIGRVFGILDSSSQQLRGNTHICSPNGTVFSPHIGYSPWVYGLFHRVDIPVQLRSSNLTSATCCSSLMWRAEEVIKRDRNSRCWYFDVNKNIGWKIITSYFITNHPCSGRLRKGCTFHNLAFSLFSLILAIPSA